MKTRYKLLFSVLLVWAQVFAPSLIGRVEGGSALMAQDAFYIYRNDGDFNGFFFDEIKRMGYSKFDLDSVEYDVYVVQEIETADSLYRIPLAAIDSIGFQQPDIILSENFHEVNGYLSTVQTNWQGCYFTDDEGYTLCWAVNEKKYLPTPGMVIYLSRWADAATTGYGDHRRFAETPFVGKVKNVYKQVPDKYESGWYIVECEPVTDISDVFEQFISVEQFGADDDGEEYSRIAGTNKIKKRFNVSGQKDLTLVSLNMSLPLKLIEDNFEGGLSVDLALSVTASAQYKIERNDWFIKLSFAEDAEVGATLSAVGKLEDALTWQLGGAPFYFPSFLPILEVRPGPGVFVKTTGDVSLKVSTPKLALHGRQSISIGSNGVSGSKNFYTGRQDDNNGWSVELALNGSAQTGVHMPFKIETNRWFKKIGWCSTGIDVYAGPKLEAHFALDPVALAEGNAYGMFSGSQVKLSQKAFVIEGSAKFSAAGQKEKSYKIFEGEADFGTMTMQLFPSFNQTACDEVVYGETEIGVYKDRFVYYRHPISEATVYPHGQSIVWPVGVGVYNGEKKLINYNFDHDKGSYSLWNSWTDAKLRVGFLDGNYTVCPVINCFSNIIPVWEAGKIVTVDRPLELNAKTNFGSPSEIPWEGEMYVDYVLNKDDKIFINAEIEKADAGFITELVSREPMPYEDPNAEEYFQRATFRYKLTDEFFKNQYVVPATFVATTYRTKPDVKQRSAKNEFRHIH